MKFEIEGYDVAEVRRARLGWWVLFGFLPDGVNGGLPLNRGRCWRPTEAMAYARGRRWQARRLKATARRADGYQLWPWEDDA